MSLIEQPNYSFIDNVRSIRGLHGNDLTSLIKYSNREIFLLRRSQTPWFMNVPHSKIQVGKFYLLLYDFNGNNIYCPVFTIDYRVKESGKHVIYAINLDYLPFEYKFLYFDKVYKSYEQLFKKNKDVENFIEEMSIPINFEQIYKTLKDNGDYNYAISAFDITKMVEIFGVSTNLMHIILHVHMRPVNIALMKELITEYESGTDENEQLSKILSKLEDMQQTYEEDIKSYYKKLRNLEVNYKLIKNM